MGETTAVAPRRRDPFLGALPSLARRWREVAPQDRTASQDRISLRALPPQDRAVSPLRLRWRG